MGAEPTGAARTAFQQGAIRTSIQPNDHPYMNGAWAPQHTEHTADDMVVIGTIPTDIDGVYVRNTENPVHQPLGRYHPFDGDGMLHAITLKDGKAAYRNRFVRTKGFEAEQAEGRALYLAHCAVCHGEDGGGRGSMAAYDTYPQIGSFRDGKYASYSPGKMFRSIRSGQGNMPAFGNILTAREIWCLVAFVRRLQALPAPPQEERPVTRQGEHRP